MLQVYTGNGKGKTTAALGLALRALGAGKKVYIMQFMKSLYYSEQEILRKFSPNLLLETTGKPFFIAEENTIAEEERAKWGDVVIFPKGKPPADYVKLMGEGLKHAGNLATGFDVIILDEVNVALFFGLLSRREVENFFDGLKADGVDREIICTGRNAPPWLIDRADLVTDMQEVKHYYRQGIMARRGIED